MHCWVVQRSDHRAHLLSSPITPEQGEINEIAMINRIRSHTPQLQRGSHCHPCVVEAKVLARSLEGFNISTDNEDI